MAVEPLNTREERWTELLATAEVVVAETVVAVAVVVVAVAAAAEAAPGAVAVVVVVATMAELAVEFLKEVVGRIVAIFDFV